MARRVKIPKGAQKAPKPSFIEPAHPNLRERAPSEGDWLYEIKTDGYRAQLHIVNGNVTVYSRRGHDWTDQFAAIASAARQLKVQSCIVDGEAAVLGAQAFPIFRNCAASWAMKKSQRLRYFAFHLLYLNGYDIRKSRLIDRKTALKQILKVAPAQIQYVDFLETDGERVYE